MFLVGIVVITSGRRPEGEGQEISGGWRRTGQKKERDWTARN